MKKMKKHFLGVGISILLAELVGLLSSILSGNVKEIYQSLIKPPFAPPNWLFPAAWILLYAAMGIASYLVFTTPKGRDRKIGLSLYLIQLLINFSWSIVFFRFSSFGAALVVIIFLDLFVVLTAIFFSRISKKATCLIILYLLWLLFATYLNIGFYILN